MHTQDDIHRKNGMPTKARLLEPDSPVRQGLEQMGWHLPVTPWLEQLRSTLERINHTHPKAQGAALIAPALA